MFWNSIKIITGIALVIAAFDSGLNWISFFTGGLGLMLGLDGITDLMSSLWKLRN